jgi:SAM-dependent MidA family methyltransferase
MWLTDLIHAEGGRIRFDRFMEWALYHPVHGYYTATIETVGQGGDFSTSATVSALLGRSIAAWLRQELKQWRTHHVIELGAGSGELARAVCRHLPPWRRIQYHIVEVSPRLRAIQRRRLPGVRWHATIEEALDAARFGAVIFSNEFVDAFPCRRVRWSGDHWEEIYLEFKDGSLRELLCPLKELPESAVFRHSWPPGQEVEVQSSYRRWLERCGAALRRGTLLSIDYGGSAEEIYRRAPTGTLRAYWRHARISGREVYFRAGQQDLTLDVNFDDLQNWGAQCRLETVWYGTQRDFVERWSPVASRTQADSFLLEPNGPGTAFKALQQRKVE